jgi:hypothetical protein
VAVIPRRTPGQATTSSRLDWLKPEAHNGQVVLENADAALGGMTFLCQGGGGVSAFADESENVELNAGSQSRRFLVA